MDRTNHIDALFVRMTLFLTKQEVILRCYSINLPSYVCIFIWAGSRPFSSKWLTQRRGQNKIHRSLISLVKAKIDNTNAKRRLSSRCATGSTVFTDAQMERVLHLVIIGLEEVARGTLPATFSTRMSSLKDNFERAYPKLEENSAVKALMAYVIKRLNTPIR